MMRIGDRSWSGRQRPQSRSAVMPLVADGHASSWLLVVLSLGWKLYMRIWLELGRGTGNLMAGPPGLTSASSPYASAQCVLYTLQKVPQNWQLDGISPPEALSATQEFCLHFLLGESIINFSLKHTLCGSQSSFFEFSRQEPERLEATLVALLLFGILAFDKGPGVLKDTPIFPHH